jgi:putative hydrolase of the HAD superfamily
LPPRIVPELVRVIRGHEPVLALGPGAQATLARLRADGWRLAILTNGLPATQRAKVEALGLDTRVDAVLYAEEHAPGGKPSRAAFVAALDALGVSPGEAVFIGDDLERDVHGGRAAGLATIRLATAATAATATAAVADADAVVTHLDDVPQAAAALLKRMDTHAA